MNVWPPKDGAMRMGYDPNGDDSPYLYDPDKSVHTSEAPVDSFTRSPEEMAALRAQVAEANEKVKGLHHKYDVQRVNDPTGKHADCRYFVLDPQHDALAVEALEAYSDAAFSAGYVALSKEIDHWIGREHARARVPSPEHSGSPYLPCKLCDAIFPGRGGKPGGVGGCLGVEQAEACARFHPGDPCAPGQNHPGVSAGSGVTDA